MKPESHASCVPDEADRAALLAMARDAIASALGVHRRSADPIPDPAVEDRLGKISGRAFVTLKIRHRLRGCIGSIGRASPLPALVREMAVAAAFEDPRFPPLEKEELEEVELEITLLSDLKRLEKPYSIEVGRDGLYIEARGKSGLLLPQVPVEQGWNAQEFLAQVCRKAGLPATAWELPDARLYSFGGSILSESSRA